MSSGNVMMEAEHEPSREFRDVVKGGHYEAPPATSKDKEEERFMQHESSAQGSTSKRMAAQSVTTPTSAQERRSVDAERMGNGGGGGASGSMIPWHQTQLRAPQNFHSDAPGPQTFDRKYIPFAAGFAHMSSEAPVYRSSRLHTINPTAAVSDDVSYLYTLDNGRTPPAALAANPDTSAEFVRNTATQTHGGMFRRLMKPIE